MNKYEALFVAKCDKDEETTKATVEKFTDLISANGTIDECNEWGKRKLAYPIEDLNEGYYVLVNFSSNPEFPAEFNRLANISDEILRAIVIRK